MKTIIAGSRTVDWYTDLEEALVSCPFNISVVISGCAVGADRLGEQYARINKLPILFFPADWDMYGKQAGYLRNEEMAGHAEAVLILWDGNSKGSHHMMDIAKRDGLPLHMHIPERFKRKA